MSVDTQALQREVEDLLQFLYLMPVAVLRLDASGRVAMLNPKAVQLLRDLDIDGGQADGPTILAALCPSMADAWSTNGAPVGPVMPPQRCSLQRPLRDPLHLLLQLIRIDENCSMLAIEDITSAVEYEREASRQRRRLTLALEHIRGYGVIMLDHSGTMIEWNPSIGSLFGVTEGGLQGQRLLDWMVADPAVDDMGGLPTDFEAIRSAVAGQGWCQLQAPWHHLDGTRLWGDCVITPLIEADGSTSGYVAVVRDITEERQREQQLLTEALTDPLTGLLNRRGLEQRLGSLQPRLAQTNCRPGWIIIDIDHFKQINDTHGHEGGDVVLKAVAADLQRGARDGDVVARVGGEEFVLVLPFATAETATSVAERVRERLQGLTATTGSHTVHVTASFGVALQGPAEGWASALQRADTALYAAKRSGRNCVVMAID